MTDFATLYLMVNARGMIEGVQSLDALTAKGAATEKTVTTAMNKVGASGKVASTGLKAAEAAAKSTAAGMQQAAAQAARAGQEVNRASGYTANLASNFNDIAVMMAAGQNPLQLAMQQGTQITQVMTALGGGVAALKGIGTAFMSMINPMSLATLGVIGFGAAAVQWFTDAGAEAKDFDDALDDLKSAVDAYKSSIDKAMASTADLYEQFGTGSVAARSLYRDLAEVQKRQAISAGQAVSASLRDKVAPTSFLASDQKNAADIFGLSVWSRPDRVKINRVIGGLDDLERANDLDAQIEALERLKVAIEEAASADGKFSQEEDAALAGVNELLIEQIELRERIGAMENGGNGRVVDLGKLVDLQRDLAKSAQDELVKLQQQAELSQLIAMFGADSVVVAVARRDAEREAYQALWESKGAAGELLNDLMDAWDAAHGLAGVHMASNINNAGFAASFLATEMGKALNYAQLLGGFAPDLNRFGGAGLMQTYGQTTGSTTWYWDKTADSLLPPSAGLKAPKARGGRKGGGGGGGAARENAYERSVIEIEAQTQAFLAQADAMAKVVAAGGDWERALAILEEEQKLLNDAQKAGVEITPEVKARITEMATAYVDAEAQMERLRTATEKGQDAFENLFGSILDGADSAKEALASLLDQMAKAQFTKGMMMLLGSTSWGSSLISGVGSLLSTYDGGGYTWDGPRTGGLDGKGGRLAMLHPQETVIDHTKGQTGAISAHITASFDEEGNAYVKRVAQGLISQAAPGIVRQSVGATYERAREYPLPGSRR